MPRCPTRSDLAVRTHRCYFLCLRNFNVNRYVFLIRRFLCYFEQQQFGSCDSEASVKRVKNCPVTCDFARFGNESVLNSISSPKNERQHRFSKIISIQSRRLELRRQSKPDPIRIHPSQWTTNRSNAGNTEEYKTLTYCTHNGVIPI